ncbi:histone-lysine N-methyltransferase, H3 lysine-79 specific-like [Fundulus heteroclitus]|uniref:histone-lysine N-methyltransferase, H3 lysine-79 specific-like n=1 Tax=Fundulus heteroclitus TaxID=8078 RepID=UPI00165A80AF|nr:histone-lysine N-methyltransferase, H3 lysine-79 specific-like [Fundulus heteroclitus]
MGNQNNRTQEMDTDEQKEHGLRPALKEKETKAFQQRTPEMDTDEQKEHDLRSSLRQKEKETEDLKQRIEQIEAEKEAALKEKEKETEALKQRVQEMEAGLQRTRSDAEEKEEQLKSFKDRVAGDVALSIKTGETMSLNSPVNKNRLTEMYDTLRCDWPKMKKCFKSNQIPPDSVKELIQTKFREAKAEMKERKMLINKVFRSNGGAAAQMAEQYRKLTIQNLQLTLYHEKNDAGSKKPFLGNTAENPQDLMAYLGTECYWLGCLMALNSPPLQPDWENHPQSMDKWDFFPKYVTTASENE